ncbi:MULTISPECIES: helix-turn-helix domain-containing protein [unclassified Deinococcus]|uniref:helix-turn-helix domain-containing protein n=1 Tax=unclassified Deinococcus TaxID=2623546 RepID=UPI001E312475|nr:MULTISPECIES: helix-turn-helix transcriptional regulator [unclassified Deinococcus]MCD0164787.1 helix-turn-helix transcriptional regulator [Deinococcus sp. 12RED42]MCD0168891.1 helix-turn-helix transcriptional regulator [Deinococcus sp. 23YEL01]MCD0174434.1 helix-turn-helix transcriptional regulator [Deinococcus sp. 14RED07]
MSARPARLRLAANVRRQRKLLHLSQEELGDRAGIHRTYIGEIEREGANVTVDHMQKLADALGIDVSRLFSED